MADRFVKTPADVVKVNQKIEVTVLAIDEQRKRIALSMKKTPSEKPADQKSASESFGTGPVERKKIEPGRPPQRHEKKKTREAPQPFNNPFIEAFKKK